jgi:hypothetical protein
MKLTASKAAIGPLAFCHRGLLLGQALSPRGHVLRRVAVCSERFESRLFVTTVGAIIPRSEIDSVTWDKARAHPAAAFGLRRS